MQPSCQFLSLCIPPGNERLGSKNDLLPIAWERQQTIYMYTIGYRRLSERIHVVIGKPFSFNPQRLD
jgi:hypothetical protein